MARPAGPNHLPVHTVTNRRSYEDWVAAYGHEPLGPVTIHVRPSPRLSHGSEGDLILNIEVSDPDKVIPGEVWTAMQEAYALWVNVR